MIRTDGEQVGNSSCRGIKLAETLAFGLLLGSFSCRNTLGKTSCRYTASVPRNENHKGVIQREVSEFCIFLNETKSFNFNASSYKKYLPNACLAVSRCVVVSTSSSSISADAITSQSSF